MFLSFSKLKVLSDISRDVGIVFFASLFIGPLINNSFDFILLVSGLILSLIFWAISLLIVK